MWLILYSSIWGVLALNVAFYILNEAFDIRMYAIKNFGYIIHEFDPYFNFRATEYLYEHGWKKFANWFDYLVWYPLGRPVGTTIYPGMQVTAVFIKNWIVGDSMSLNDVCCLIPAWFGALATLFTGLIAYECSVGVTLLPEDHIAIRKGEKLPAKEQIPSNYPQVFGSILSSIPIVKEFYHVIIVPIVNFLHKILVKVAGSDLGLRDKPSSFHEFSSPAVECALFTMAIMSVVPAHMMRSVAGGFDNESVAIAALTGTFYMWIRSLRGGPDSPAWKYGILAGLAYFYMVAAWGGYVFVINLIGVHAGLLFLFGRYSTKLYRAYSLFYVIGTSLATTVPVVGWTPLKSLEQLGPCLVFLGFQLIEFCETIRRRKNLGRKDAWKVRIGVFFIAGVIGAGIAYILQQKGYFGPISSRVRGLFVKHTKTGNPLVDSVAEHQPASTEAYLHYLLDAVYIAPAGIVLVALFYFHDASSFLLVYAATAYFFSHKMVRLVLLTAPIASILGGLALGRAFGWWIRSIVEFRPSIGQIWQNMWQFGAKDDKNFNNNKSDGKKKSNGKKDVSKQNGGKKEATASSGSKVFNTTKIIIGKLLRVGLGLYVAQTYVKPRGEEFHKTSREKAEQMSHPTILFKGTLQSGEEVTVDDYRDAYWWLRDNTPEDARIMAWWDYGYQITAIANRTTIADGNTWNHEHIALLGRALTSPEKEGHRIARHLADYMLVWAGGGGDDLAKSPHLARIANSVYRHMCPNDPTCRRFGFTQQGQPSEALAASLLYRLHSHGKPGVEADKNRFREVYRSKYGKVRIYKILSVSKQSKEWVADPANRICDAPGSWYCKGQYPPALQKVLAEKKDFTQLEDFNAKKDADSDYQKKYFENLNDPSKASKMAEMNDILEKQKEKEKQKEGYPKTFRPDPAIIAQLQNKWEDGEVTTQLWQLIANDDIDSLKGMIKQNPYVVFVRSGDGRGPLWWAYEHKRQRMINIFKRLGLSETDKDVNGIMPIDLID